ncbi:pyruvate formate-lyase-activating protein [Exiguobacterium flavidum]|uniref:pyruvate formate-lyase-activating protein n=1 Tax=Exiguobacterium flavidum TaxID=2184695 RepID=UPI000DF867C3|nr:pyruvate formate-lyase-activating protein [Exiguobacterium flavidum]
MTYGMIHSTESCGTVDGPGIRFIAFTQGCPLRCQYCHNADTWEFGCGRRVTPESIVSEALGYRSFLDASGGGITFSGGEPLAQPEFLEAALREAKSHGLHTAIDTAGSVKPANIEQILEQTDLVLLDIKHIDDAACRILTGRSNKNTLEFAQLLSDRGIPVWIRHVLIPGITLNEEFLRRTGEFIGTLKNVERVEVLPYHQLGVYKWEALGLEYALKDVEPPTAEETQWAESLLNAHLVH